MNDKKNVIWSTIGISCNVFISLFFLIIIARVNTIEDVGIFSFAFSLANTMYVIGSFGGRVYQVTDEKGEFTDNEYVGFRICSSILMMLITIIFIICNGYNIYKSVVIILLVGFKFIESISDAYFGIMQKDNKLHCVGKSMASKAIIGIGVFLIIDILIKNVIMALLSLIIVNLVIFIFYDLSVTRTIKKIRPSFNIKMLNRMFRVCFYFCAFTFLSAIVINFPRYAIDIYSAESQAVFGIIIMPATCIALFGQFILQPILVNLSNLYNSENKKGFVKLIRKAVLLLVAFTAICEVGAYILGIPVLEIMYNMKLEAYKRELLMVILGSLFSTIASVLSVALTTMRVTKEQLWLYIINVIIAIIVSLILVKYFTLIGGVLSYVIIMIIQFVSYYILYRYKVSKGEGYEK